MCYTEQTKLDKAKSILVGKTVASMEKFSDEFGDALRIEFTDGTVADIYSGNDSAYLPHISIFEKG